MPTTDHPRQLPAVPPEPGHVAVGSVHAYCPVCEAGGHERPCWCCGHAGPFVQEWVLRCTSSDGIVKPVHRTAEADQDKAAGIIQDARTDALRTGNRLLQTLPR